MLTRNYNILLVGDNCQDRYQYGWVDRISPEAPVPVFRISHELSRPGMAGNVYENLLKFNCYVNYIYDQTSVKTRLIDLRSGQHIVRIDDDATSSAIRLADNNFAVYDAVVISDYNKGSVDIELIQTIRTNYSGPIFVDTKIKDLVQLEGCFVKINALEYSMIRSECSDLIVTLGQSGARYRGIEYSAQAIEVVDTCGAGDTFLAALCFGYLNNNNDIDEAIHFANRASAITIQHSGVYSPTMEEICGFQD